MGGPCIEIERKWLLSCFPEDPGLPEEWRCEMEQGYLAFEPCAVRIRRTRSAGGESFLLTVKGAGTLVRSEVELPLDAEQYAALKPLLAAPPAIKQLRTYRLPGGELLECNLVDEGEACAFYYAEVEFGNVEAARAFVPPAFLGAEMTEDGGFTMAAHCRRKAGLPNTR